MSDRVSESVDLMLSVMADIEKYKNTNKLQHEYIKEVNEELTQERERRESAEKALRFYSKKENWFIDKDDWEAGSMNDGDTGETAREHFKKYDSHQSDE